MILSGLGQFVAGLYSKCFLLSVAGHGPCFLLQLPNILSGPPVSSFVAATGSVVRFPYFSGGRAEEGEGIVHRARYFKDYLFENDVSFDIFYLDRTENSRNGFELVRRDKLTPRYAPISLIIYLIPPLL